MANPSKDEGTWCESQTVKAFERAGIPAHRPGLRGVLDHGDVWAGINGQIVVEVKGGKQTQKPSWNQIRAWWAEAELEAGRVLACDVTLLVLRRWGSGKAEDWTAYVSVTAVAWLMNRSVWMGDGGPMVSMRLGDLLSLLAARYREGVSV